ncbi:MAG: ATP synthase F0 subunit B [Myxococcota bacterium]
MKRLRDLLDRLLGNREGRRLLAGLAGATALILCGIARASSAAHGHELHINWWTWDQEAPPVGWFIVDFVLFIYLLYSLAGKSVTSMFAKRHETVADMIAEAKEAHEKAQEHYDWYQNKLKRIDAKSANWSRGPSRTVISFATNYCRCEALRR